MRKLLVREPFIAACSQGIHSHERHLDQTSAGARHSPHLLRSPEGTGKGEKAPLPCQKLLDYGQGRLARGINDLCLGADIMTDYQSLGYDKILVTLDGTETQRRVLERAIIVAANNHSELYIGHVIDSTALEAAGTYPAELIADLERAFRDSIADDVAKVQEEGVVKSVEVIVKAGRIRETLTDEMIDVINPDLIVCGARGLSTIKYALLGSISAFLTRNASCDTLVIK